jgi:hypothetical protein
MLISKDKLYDLKNQIIMSRKMNEEELSPIVQENVHRYIGTYVPQFAADWDINLNEVYPIIQANLPAIFFRNPRVFMKPRTKFFFAKKRNPISGQMEEIQLDASKSAKTQEGLLNYLLPSIGYKEEVRKTLLDALLYPYGILWHGYKGDFGMTEEQSLVIEQDKIFVKRLSPMRFIHDPAVNISNIDEARWVGRIIDIPLEDLVEDDRLDVDKKIIKGANGYGEIIGTNTQNKMMQTGAQDYMRINAARRQLIEFTDKGYMNSKAAKFVQVQEIYLRPTKAEKRKGEKGWILLLTDEQEKPLRENKWEVKAKGFPTEILQFNDLPDTMFGLSDPETYKQIADQKNIITNLQIRNAQENSKVWIGLSKEGASEDDIEHIRLGEQSIITFESGKPQDKMMVASPGGQASSELYLIDGRIQKNLDDKSGVTDLRRGVLQSGEESAFSVKQRAMGASARPAYRQDLMADFLRKSCSKLNQLNKQFMTIKDAVRLSGTLDIEWSENPTKEEIQAEVDVEIDVYSMLPENPQQELQELQMILQMMIGAINDPGMSAKIAQEGKTINLTPIIEQMLMRMKLKDPEIFRNIKPEEAMGFSSNQQLMQAGENVQAALHGQPVPNAPQPTDDHRAKLTIYTQIASLLQEAGQVSDTLNQLILVHQSLMQQIAEKEGGVGSQPKLAKGIVKPL